MLSQNKILSYKILVHYDHQKILFPFILKLMINTYLLYLELIRKTILSQQMLGKPFVIFQW